MQECVKEIQEIHLNSSTLVKSGNTVTNQQSQTSNSKQVLIPVQKIKEAQSHIKNLNSIFSNMLNPASDSVETFRLPDPFEQVQEILDTSQDSRNQNVIPPLMTDRATEKSVCAPTQNKFRDRGQAAIITDESYKAKLIEQKLKTMKKEPREPAAKKARAKPIVKSSILIKPAPTPKPSRKRKSDPGNIPEVLQNKVLSESQNIPLKEIIILQSDEGSKYQVLNDHNYPVLLNSYPNYQLDMSSNSAFNICSEVPIDMLGNNVVDENVQMLIHLFIKQMNYLL